MLAAVVATAEKWAALAKISVEQSKALMVENDRLRAMIESARQGLRAPVRMTRRLAAWVLRVFAWWEPRCRCPQCEADRWRNG